MDLIATHQTSFEDQHFIGLDHRESRIQHKEFINCIFKSCRFNDTIFEACTFIECRFEETDLSLARVPNSTFWQTVFHDSKLVGINWTEARWNEQSLLKKKFIDFQSCTLDYSIFIGLTLVDMIMQACSAKHTDFEEADLTGANCSQTNFLAARFVRTDLSKADFAGATNYTIDARLNTLQKTKFSLPEAMSLLYSLDIELVE